MALIDHLAAAHGIDVLLMRSLVGERLNDGGAFSLEIQDDASFRICEAPADYGYAVGRVIGPSDRLWRVLAAFAMRFVTGDVR